MFLAWTLTYCINVCFVLYQSRYKDSPFEDISNFGGFPSRGSGIDDLLSGSNNNNETKFSDNWGDDFVKVDKPPSSSYSSGNGKENVDFELFSNNYTQLSI